MNKQRCFMMVVVVVVMAVVTPVLLYLSTSSSPSSFTPIRKLLRPIMDPAAPPPQSPPPHPPFRNTWSVSSPSMNTSHPSLPPAPLETNSFPYLPFINPALEDLHGAPDVFKDDPVEATDKDGNKLKIILYWNDAYSNKHFGLGYGRKPFLLAGCRVNTCLATGDRNRYDLSQVDAILWHLRAKDRSFPKKRYPHTSYVFWMMESASHTFANLNAYKNKFNLTFTYRRDSDMYNPYQRVFRRRNPLPLPTTPINYAEGKTKLAAWFVSNCHTLSGREQLVKALKKWISVDVYGACGSLKCGRDKHGECMAMLDKSYKFYFSFENSLCKDYVTEKFFGALSVNVVPVVWGLGNYHEVAPRHSYIDALTFPSAQALADYLLYLDSNDTAYNQYFWWKPYYHQTHDWGKKSIAFCDLCERLHSDEPPKTYDLKKWFQDDSHCLSSHDASIKKYIQGSEKGN